MTSSADPSQHPYLLLAVGDAEPITILEGTGGSRIGATPYATLQLPAVQRGQLAGVDLTDEARVEAVEHGNRFLQLTGFVSRLTHDRDVTRIELHGTTVVLHERTVALRHDKVPGPEMISYLLSLCGVPIGRQDVEGLEFPDTDVSYVGIVPIDGCAIEGAWQIGRLALYGRDSAKDDEDRRFDELLASEDAVTATSAARGRVTVQARTFLEAESLIRDEVDRALDWIAFRCAISEPLISIGAEQINVSWVRARALGMPRSSKLAYCRRTTDDAAWVQEIAGAAAAPQLTLSDTTYFSQTYPTFEALLSAEHSELSDAERSILLSLHWHRRARQAERSADRLVDYWTAIEYVIARAQIPKLFTNQELSLMKDRLKVDWEGDVRWNAIVDAVGSANASPLPQRLRSFIADNNVPISAADYEVLWSTRRWRNDLVHGRSIPLIDEPTLTKLGALAERMILRRAAAHTNSAK
ncbi:MAG: hypothetical protein M3P30_11190 [Chloroflexota bacterium]|nr:hypothetical protein [Chloroflexota bacterium]